MKFLCKEQKLVLLRRRLFFSFLCECVSCSYDATAAKSPLFEVNSIQFRGKEKFNLLSLVYGLKKIPIREFYPLIEQQRQINPTKKACAIMHVQSVQSNVMLVKNNCFNFLTLLKLPNKVNQTNISFLFMVFYIIS